ncbi:hypothetical protein [Krasilnikovia sp. MM14-A1259]|uniref:hypothetical protein n=1 Tax=Krasilnikovia sp. MM14-A1259 TaxID=3373539 RepID=UPI00381A7FDC
MGTGGKSSHQSYAVAPTAAPAPDTSTMTATATTDATTDATTTTATAAAAGPLPPQVSDFLDELMGAIDTVMGHEPVTEPAVATETAAAADAPADVAIEPPPEPPASAEATPPEAVEDPEPTPARDAPLLPVPDEVPVGLATGVPALVGGADLVDSAATVIAYDGPDGPREVLLATVDEAAEAKLLEALADGSTEMVATQVQQEVNGRLPVDEQQQLHEQVAKAAKSVNHRLKNGDAIPEHVLGYLTAAEQAVAAVQNDPGATADEKAMAAHYGQHLAAIRDRVDGTVSAGYTEGGKIPMVEPYLHTGLATVTTMVPVPGQANDGLAITSRQATRINASIDPATGTASWDGTARSKAGGTEYAIDLGDGYQAVYRPYAANDPKHTDYSLRGKLEVIAPPGTGHAAELVDRLGQLHLVNRPMTAGEGEWSYLQANITAQGLATNPAVAGALADSAQLQDLVLQELYYSHAHEAVGKSDTELAAMARGLQLEAAARVLPKKVTAVRDAVAQATGHADGAALAASAGYDPTPQRSGGWLTWSRFDVGADPKAVAQAFKGKKLVHRLGGGGLTQMLSTGVLASTERRATMGTATGIGMSEAADKKSGGANSVFLRVSGKAPSGGPALVWDDPHVLIRRADWYGYNGDHFGAINPANSNYSGSLTRDPMKVATFGASNNEVMFREGIDLLGAEAPSRIVCSGAGERAQILKLLTDRGITELRGRPIDQVVT